MPATKKVMPQLTTCQLNVLLMLSRGDEHEQRVSQLADGIFGRPDRNWPVVVINVALANLSNLGLATPTGSGTWQRTDAGRTWLASFARGQALRAP